MERFAFERAQTPEEVITLLAQSAAAPNGPQTAVLAGGTTLIDLMKLNVMQPDRVVDINLLANEWSGIDLQAGELRLGSLVRMSDVLRQEEVVAEFPALARSLSMAASTQLRNMASLGGNLLQRTRCTYFRDTKWEACNKRQPGSGCSALEGYNRLHAVLGVSDACIATYPGDFAPALVALDAQIDVVGPSGPRTLAAAALHREPGTTPHIETTLQPAELIAAIRVPRSALTRRSTYVKVRDRASYEFAVVSAAVALALDADKRVLDARIALGGVASRPWRATAAEDALKGKVLNEASASEAAKQAFTSARTRPLNAFKVEIGQQAVVRALLEAGTMEI